VDVKDLVLELVNRGSFKQLGLIIFCEEHFDELIFSLESNENLRIKLETFERRNPIGSGFFRPPVEEWKRMVPLMISLKSVRIQISSWLDFKAGIIELVSRSSFKRLELFIKHNANCDDLLFTIESNANLKLKLKALVQNYNIHRPILFEDWKRKAKDPSILKSNEFFLRLLNVTQGLEEFRFDICRECTPIGSGKYNDNRTKDEDYPALLNNFNPKKMKILSYICNVPCEYALKLILLKCGPTLKQLKIKNWGGSHIVYPLDEILSLCPNLLRFNAGYADLRISSNSSNPSASYPTGRISPMYPLRYLSSYCHNKDSVISWLFIHCPNLKPDNGITLFDGHF